MLHGPVDRRGGAVGRAGRMPTTPAGCFHAFYGVSRTEFRRKQSTAVTRGVKAGVTVEGCWAGGLSAEVAAGVDSLVSRALARDILVGRGSGLAGGERGALVVEALALAGRRPAERVGSAEAVAVPIRRDGPDLLLPGGTPGRVARRRAEARYPGWLFWMACSVSASARCSIRSPSSLSVRRMSAGIGPVAWGMSPAR